ncbi:hypothetical protein C0991_004104, partial [Blastosporella zonata]
VDDLESPTPKVAKRAGGRRPSVNQNPSFQKTMADMAGSHATVDKVYGRWGLGGDHRGPPQLDNTGRR